MAARTESFPGRTLLAMDTAAPAQPPFQHEAQASLDRLRAALAAVVSEIPEPVGKAADLQRALNIQKTLAWQIYRIATATHPLLEASNLPGPFALERFLKKAQQAGVSSETIARARSACDEVAQLIKAHAGDRDTFDSMVGGLAEDRTAAQIDLQHRRAAFRAQRHMFGVQAGTTVSLMMFRPAQQPGCVDGVLVGGHVNLRRFRQDARWILFGRTVASDQHPLGAEQAQPLSAEDFERFGAPLLSAFSRMPPGTFRMIQTDQNVRYIEVSAADIGNNSTATYLSGEVWRNVAYTVQDNGEQSLLARARVRLPVEVLYHDVLVHRDLKVDTPPRIDQYGDLRSGDDALSHEHTERLPLHETVRPSRRGLDALQATEVPDYPELARYALDQVGWEHDAFELFRFRLAYPVLPSTVVLRFRALT